VVTACALGAAAILWRYAVRDHLRPENFGIVHEGVLYRSADLTPAATRVVHDRYAVRTIVDLGAYEPDSPEERTAQRTAEALGVKRHVFRLEGDGTGDPNAYVAALRVITDPAQQPVLVHCAAGAQRTSGCVALYRQFMQGVSFEEAYREARRYKHSPRDNPKLRPYLEQWTEGIRRALATGAPVAGFEGASAVARSVATGEGGAGGAGDARSGSR
jgi:protein tyrosine/serine phosphatase